MNFWIVVQYPFVQIPVCFTWAGIYVNLRELSKQEGGASATTHNS